MNQLRLFLLLLILATIFHTAFAQDDETISPQIALSFDDAPWGDGIIFSGPERTDRLINQLEKIGVPQVVFFCVTEKLPYHQGYVRLKRYAAAGHLIGNHSHSHNRPGDFGAASYIADIEQAHDSLRQYSTFTPWYRYPMLNEGKTIPVRDSVREALNSLGYSNGYVTVDTWDWYIDKKCRDAAKDGLAIDTVALGRIYVETLREAVQFYDNMARDVLGYSPKHILLLHENDLAALFVDDLVNLLREQGWEIISPTEAYNDPLANRVPDVLYNNQGRVAAVAVELGYEGPLRHASENAEYIDSLIQANRVFHEP
jgi:peptidoglycan/xylan/chitin deacetylase (PgdA/CDA1 family)